MSRRILITGASGFVGANLTRRLLRDGAEVHLILRPDHQPWRIREIAGDISVHQIDLHNRDSVRSVVGQVRPDWVFHLAAFGAYSTQQGMQQMVETNVLGCVSLLDSCVEFGVESFVNTGSSSEYGLKDHAATETDVAEPNSHYAITKLAATHYCALTARQKNRNIVTARLYSIYGPYEEPTRLIPTLIVRCLHGKLPPLVSPATARDFVYVDDAVEAMIQLASSQSARGAIYNICGGKQITLGEAVEQARTQMNVRSEPQWATMEQRSWDTNVWVGSGDAMAKDHGWQPAIGFAEGLGRTVEWFRAHPDWLRFYSETIDAAAASV